MCTIIPDSHPSADTPLGDVAELNARRIAAAAFLGDYKAELASAALGSPPGREWMLRLASVLEDLLAVLGGPDDEDDFEPYCAGCGASIGIFIGHGDAWLHYTGEGTTASPVELYDAGHEPEVAWRPARVPRDRPAVLEGSRPDPQRGALRLRLSSRWLRTRDGVPGPRAGARHAGAGCGGRGHPAPERDP